MNEGAPRSNVHKEFLEIDSKGAWPQLYQVWKCAWNYVIEPGLIQVQGQRTVFKIQGEEMCKILYFRLLI